MVVKRENLVNVINKGCNIFKFSSRFRFCCYRFWFCYCKFCCSNFDFVAIVFVVVVDLYFAAANFAIIAKFNFFVTDQLKERERRLVKSRLWRTQSIHRSKQLIVLKVEDEEVKNIVSNWGGGIFTVISEGQATRDTNISIYKFYALTWSFKA